MFEESYKMALASRREKSFLFSVPGEQRHLQTETEILIPMENSSLFRVSNNHIAVINLRKCNFKDIILTHLVYQP